MVKGNLLDVGSPVISRWAPTHGLEAIANWRCLLLGVMVLFLARTQAALYFINNIRDDETFTVRCRKRVLWNGAIFVVLFLAFAAVLLAAPGLEVTTDAAGKETFTIVSYKYLQNYVDMWWCAIILVIGVVLVLYGIGMGAFAKKMRGGIWYSGIGTVLVVLTLFWVAGYNNTAYYPSLTDPASSLTIANSSSSPFTLKVMSYVSLIVPFVAAYIIYVWYKMDRKSITPAEMKSGRRENIDFPDTIGSINKPGQQPRPQPTKMAFRSLIKAVSPLRTHCFLSLLHTETAAGGGTITDYFTRIAWSLSKRAFCVSDILSY